MRRAISLLLLVAATLPLGETPARSQGQAIMNGIGLVDYSRKPDFKVGDWVKYRMSSESEMGMTDDFVLTLIVAGEEDFWGDPGFWLETWVDRPGRPPEARASLMSYEIFSDSSAIDKLMLYMRKTITTLDDSGKPRIDINKPATSTLKARYEVKNPVKWTREALGADTVQTPRGTFNAQVYLFKQGKGVTQTVGDSTIYTEVREDRKGWYATEIPITHLAREDITTSSSRKSWMIGRSGDVTKLNIRDQGVGTARLLDYGSGIQPRLLPPRFRKSFAEQRAAERAPARVARPTAVKKQ